jgi:hypothetical protein
LGFWTNPARPFAANRPVVILFGLLLATLLTLVVLPAALAVFVETIGVSLVRAGSPPRAAPERTPQAHV